MMVLKANLSGRCCKDKTQGCQSCRGTPLRDIVKYYISSTSFRYLKMKFEAHLLYVWILINISISKLNTSKEYDHKGTPSEYSFDLNTKGKAHRYNFYF